MKRLIQSCLLFLSLSVSAQEGAPLLTHYNESRDIENQSWAICQDEDRVMLFANRKGILSFDGEEWTNLKISFIPFSMQVNPYDGKIYVGGENNYGYIEKSRSGVYEYINLSVDSADIGLITKMIFNDTVTWFYGERSISRYNHKTEKLEVRLYSEPGIPFAGMFVTPMNTFINLTGKGLSLIKSDSVFPIKTRDPAGKKQILFSLPYDHDVVLIGFSDGKMSLYDGNKYYDYVVKDNGYLKDNYLSEGLIIGDSLYAFSTLDGGALVVNKYNREVRFKINTQNGLPDDEIFAMGYDRSGGLWLSHQFGLTRADLILPIGNFSIYPGLKGNLTNSVRHNGELYVATSEGVFYLARVKNYSEAEVLIKNEIDENITDRADQQLSSLIPANKVKHAEPQETRKKIFARIFGKKSAPEMAETVPEAIEHEVVVSNSIPLVRYSWQKISTLKSIDYVFKKVEGLDDKCRQLVSTEHGILVATNRGLFVINNHKATLISVNKYVNFISWQPEGEKYSIATGDGYFHTFFKNRRWRVEVPDPGFNDPVYSVIQTEENTWLGGENIAYKTDIDPVTGKVIYSRLRVDVDYPQRYYVNMLNDTMYLFTETGMNFYDKTTNSFIEYNPVFPPVSTVKKAEYPLSNFAIMKYGQDWRYINKGMQANEKDLLMLKLFDDIVSVDIEEDYLWIIDRENNLFRIDPKKSSKIVSETTLLIKNIQNEYGNSFDISDIVLNRGDNVINFKIIVPVYLKQNLTQYQYLISKNMADWSSWSTQTSFSMYIQKPGEYTLQIRAKDMWGVIGETVSLKFTIKAPFTKTSLFYILVIITILIIIFFVVRFREKQLQQKNRILEDKVKERTAEIEAQKGEITSSIQYASRIQYAMLPMKNLFKEAFSDYFIIFKPRNIVSGDFYWIGEDEKQIFLTVADCTGHGVPGAFMSALGISVLNEIVTHNKNLQANTFLNLLRDKIKKSLHQTGKEGEAADGMDISLCVFKKNKKSIQFAGAFNPLYIFTGGELKEFKADRMPIGIHYGMEVSFTNYEIPVRKGDVIYILSDGLTDQFGGPESTKYKKANLRRIISEIHFKPLADQKRIIESEFMRWKGNAEQVDDVTVIGIRI